MQNLINFIDIPANDLARAVTFYQAILNLEIQVTDMYGAKMAFFPSDGTNVSGAIVAGDGHKPSSQGVLAYLNGGDDLQKVLDKVEPNNGKVIVPKTHISKEVGYIGIFIDTEGNKMAVHSVN